jgi:autotransporter-associated beta strand protein
LTIAGSGELTLSGSDSYTGGTTVSGGTLDIANPSALSQSGLVTIGSGGRLVLGSGGGIGALLAAGADIVDPLSTPLSGSSPAAADAAALVALGTPADGAAAASGDEPSASGPLASLPPGNASTAVPEPTSIAMGLAAFGGLGLWVLVRRKVRRG